MLLVLAGVDDELLDVSEGAELDELEGDVVLGVLPLIEPDVPEVLGGVELLLVLVLGLELSVELELLEELGVDGMVLLVEDGEVAEVLLLSVPVLLRSQPVTAAVAKASTATRGMNLFMASPFESGVVGVRRSLAAPVRGDQRKKGAAQPMPDGFAPEAGRGSPPKPEFS